jgi:hypothetical protein
MSESVCETRAHNPGGRPRRNTKVGLPGLTAELAPLDLNRLLPAEILRLLVGQDFLRIDVRVDGF